MHKEGFGTDTNNCTIRTLAIAFGMSYADANHYGLLAGRKFRDGFWMHRLLKEVYQRKGYRNQLYSTNGITINQFLKQNRSGRWIAVIRGHCFPIIDGYIYDQDINKPRSIIRSLWKVESMKDSRMFATF